jgi:hypothetical protein
VFKQWSDSFQVKGSQVNLLETMNNEHVETTSLCPCIWKAEKSLICTKASAWKCSSSACVRVLTPMQNTASEVSLTSIE